LAIYDNLTKEYRTYDMQDYDDFTLFAQDVFIKCTWQNCYIDFHFNEIYLPGKRKTQALKYYLAGGIANAAKKCVFVEPKSIREMLGFSARVPKREVQKTALILYPQLRGLSNHEIDAFLLTEWGRKNGKTGK
jgi:hypothetical protein